MLQHKFQCHYKLTVGWPDGDAFKIAEIIDPISIHFNVSKSLYQTDSAVSTITLYNIDPSIRECIYQDRLLFDWSKSKTFTLEAGYGDTLTLVSAGRIQQCHSELRGTDMVTVIEVMDPDILNQYTSVTFEAGTTFKEAYKYLVSQFPNLQPGECGTLEGTFKSPTIFEGNSFFIINQLTGKHTFIDNGKINTLQDNETLQESGAYLVTSETGLLGTPKRYDAILEVSMLFEPKLKLGQLVEIQSDTQSRFNGQYRINGITHDCTISSAECGTRTTTIQLIYLDWIADSNSNITGSTQKVGAATVINNNVQPLNTIILANARATYEFVQKNNGRIPNTWIIQGVISWKDMLKHNNKADEIKTDLTLEKTANCEAVANRLYSFVNKYFPGKKITINSGFRTVANNRREGGVANSQHLYGRAIDFKLSGVTAKNLANVAKSSKMFSWVGEYSTWVHVDIRK